MNDFSFQGKCYLGLRDPVTGKQGQMFWVGDASQLQVKLSTSTTERQESFTGNRLTSVRLMTAKKADFTLVLSDFSAQNLAFALYGTQVDVTTGTVTAEAFPATVAQGDVIALDHRDVSSVVITDSTVSTPKQLVEGTDYTLDSGAAGIVTMSGALTGFTQPFKAAYSYAASCSIPMFTTGVPEKYIIFDGINTVDNSEVRVRLYRAVFDPAQQLDLISNALGTLSLQGSILYDQVNAANSNMGGFGLIELPTDVTP